MLPPQSKSIITSDTSLTDFRYHIPKNVQEHVDYITPGIKLLSEGHMGAPPRRMKDAGQLRRRANFNSKAGVHGPPDSSRSRPTVDEVDCREDLVPDCIRGWLKTPIWLGTALTTTNRAIQCSKRNEEAPQKQIGNLSRPGPTLQPGRSERILRRLGIVRNPSGSVGKFAEKRTVRSPRARTRSIGSSMAPRVRRRTEVSQVPRQH
jgi:hypothetical protein